MNESTVKTHWWTKLLSPPGWLVILAVGLAVVAVGLFVKWRYDRTQQLVEELQFRGAKVGFEQGGPDWLRNLIGDKWMKPFDHANSVSFIYARMGDDGFQDYLIPLNQLHGIKSLVDLGGGILGGGMELSSETYQKLFQFQDLEDIYISSKTYGDDDLSALATLEKLRSLSLDGTAVTNEGLRHLHGLKHLESVSLSNTDVTDGGVEELQKYLPGVDISDD